MSKEVEYELDGTGTLRICERKLTLMQYDMSEIAVFFLINMVEEFDEDLLFFVAGLLETYEQ
jgi:hypothetical protein